jgi:hypothetical protein
MRVVGVRIIPFEQWSFSSIGEAFAFIDFHAIVFSFEGTLPRGREELNAFLHSMY